jgi:hypothetical protein
MISARFAVIDRFLCGSPECVGESVLSNRRADLRSETGILRVVGDFVMRICWL